MPDQASADKKSASRIGCQLGRYTLEGLLGRGGFGSVYRARDTRLGRGVAIKVLERIGPRDRERFLREARALSSLQHPHLVTVHDVGEADGVLFMVLELVDGRPLADWCDPRRLLPVAEAARVVAQAARGLEAAHRRGILHRDVKPENILVEAGQARVVDFGLAFLIDRSVQRLSQTGAWIGSPAYMAPEQAGGEEPDPRTDVYGLGATLYHALCGHLPLEGADESHPAVAVHRYVPQPPSTIRPEVPPALDAICARCLAKEPRARFPDAAALALALERFESPTPSPSGGRRAWIGVGVALAVGLVAAWVSPASTPATQAPAAPAEALAARAWSAFYRCRFEAALDLADRALAIEPQRLAMRRLRASSFSNLDRDDEADAAYAELAALDPDGAEGLLARSELHHGDLAAAAPLAEQALALDPSLHPAWLTVGYDRLRVDDLEGAREAFDRAAQLEPRDPRPTVGWVSILGREERLDEALERVSRLIEDLEPHCPAGILGLRAKLHHGRGLNRLAEAELTEAVTRSPNNVDLLLWRGIVRNNLREGEASRADLQRAWALDPEAFERVLRASCPETMAEQILDTVRR